MGEYKAQTDGRMPLRTSSKLAVLALTLGFVSLMTWVLAVLVGYIFPPAAGHHSPAMGTGGHVFILLMLLSALLGPVVLITALFAVINVKRGRGMRKGIGLALLGVALAGAPYALARLLPNPW